MENKRNLTEQERLAYIDYYVKRGRNRDHLIVKNIKKAKFNKNESV